MHIFFCYITVSAHCASLSSCVVNLWLCIVKLCCWCWLCSRCRSAFRYSSESVVLEWCGCERVGGQCTADGRDSSLCLSWSPRPRHLGWAPQRAGEALITHWSLVHSVVISLVISHWLLPLVNHLIFSHSSSVCVCAVEVNRLANKCLYVSKQY